MQNSVTTNNRNETTIKGVSGRCLFVKTFFTKTYAFYFILKCKCSQVKY